MLCLAALMENRHHSASTKRVPDHLNTCVTICRLQVHGVEISVAGLMKLGEASLDGHTTASGLFAHFFGRQS